MVFKPDTKNLRLYAIIAALSAFAIMIADYLLEYITFPSNPIGTGMLETGFKSISLKRLGFSINICGMAIPFYLLGYYVIYKQLKLKRPKMAKVIFGIFLYGIMNASLIHGIITYTVMVYNQLIDVGQNELAIQISDRIYNSSALIFWIHYFMSWIIPQFMLVTEIFRGKTIYNKWLAILTPMSFLIFGSALKIISPENFQLFFVGSINRGNVILFIIAAVYANDKHMKKNKVE